MKICLHCNSIYDDDNAICPSCGTVLVDYECRNRNTYTYNTYDDVVEPIDETEHYYSEEPRIRFEESNGAHVVYRGIISDITHQTRNHTRLKKVINAAFRGEPFQFGYTSHESIIRIEERIPNRFASQRRDLVFYGDVEGRFIEGDYATFWTRRRGDRIVVDRMENNETGAEIRPGPQISAGTATVIAILLFMIAILVVGACIWLVFSGTIFEVLGAAVGGLLGVCIAILTPLAPIIALIVIIKLMVFK